MEKVKELLTAFEGKTVFISGATGLIGKTLVSRILEYNQDAAEPVRIAALVRNPEKAKRLFPDADPDILCIYHGDVTSWEPCDIGADYIIHAASETSSRAFVENPVGTIRTALRGTETMLEFARRNPCRGFVYLSSMEVYGTPSTDEKIDETHSTDLDPMKVRSCYPVSKRMCESLCASYASEYGIPARVIRLTQTFGPGVEYHDGRVFAEFARCALEGRDIVLHTKGETRRSYLYTEDAVSAILTVLLKGSNAEAYNAANEDTYCSVREMAELVSGMCAGGKTGVRIEEVPDAGVFGYAPVLRMNLDTKKLQALGWKPTTGLQQMFKNMMMEMKR